MNLKARAVTADLCRSETGFFPGKAMPRDLDSWLALMWWAVGSSESMALYFLATLDLARLREPKGCDIFTVDCGRKCILCTDKEQWLQLGTSNDLAKKAMV